MNKKGVVGLRPLVMSIVLVVLFSFFIFTFVGLAIETQNPNSEVLNSKYGLNESKQRMDQVIENFTLTSDSVYDQMGESEPTAVDFIFLIFKGAFYIPYTFLIFVFVGISALTNTIISALSGTAV